jgi:hypothetical protein
MRDVKCVVFGNAGELKPADAGIWRDADQFRTDPPLTLTPASGALGQAGDGAEAPDKSMFLVTHPFHRFLQIESPENCDDDHPIENPEGVGADTETGDILNGT